MGTHDKYMARLNDIISFFTDENGNVKRILTASDVAEYTGRDRHWCARRFGISKGRPISIFHLANRLE